MISGFPLKSRLHHELLVLNKCLNYKHYYSGFKKNIFQEQVNYNITCIGQDNRVCHFSITNRTNILSKMMSGKEDQNLNLDYDDILKAQKDDILIIDVREDFEIKETGLLPGSIHIPMDEVVKILTNLSSEEFQKKFNRQKPTLDTKIILSCRSGKRSSMVQSDIQKLGYKNAFNYLGGWIDWESKQKT